MLSFLASPKSAILMELRSFLSLRRKFAGFMSLWMMSSKWISLRAFKIELTIVAHSSSENSSPFAHHRFMMSLSDPPLQISIPSTICDLNSLKNQNLVTFSESISFRKWASFLIQSKASSELVSLSITFKAKYSFVRSSNASATNAKPPTPRIHQQL